MVIRSRIVESVGGQTEYLALQARVERLHISMQAAQIYFWEWDIATDQIEWSGNLEGELLLTEAPRNLGDFKALVHPEDLDLIGENITRALQGPDDYSATFRMVRTDGTVRWTSSNAVVIRDAHGAPVRMVGCDKDITEKQELITRLQESEAHLRTRYTSLSSAEAACQSGTWDWQIERNQVLVSDSYRALYGLGADEEVTYDSWLSTILPEDRAEVIRKTQRHFEACERYDLEFRIQHPTRGIRWIAALGSFSQDDHGRPVRFTGINIDITDRVQSEQARAKQFAAHEEALRHEQAALLDMSKTLEAQRASIEQIRAQVAHGERLKLIGQFVGNVVHDMNNLLAGVQAAGSLLRRRLQGSVHTPFVDQMDRMVAQGVKLVRQLLDLSRKGKVEAERFNIREIVLKDFDLYCNLAGPAIRVSTQFEDGCWDVFAAPSLLQTAIFNLIANARDAQPHGGAIRLIIENCPAVKRPLQLPERDYVVLTVSDDGAGMTAEVLAKVGQPFFTTKSAGSGTGLGLATVKDFAHAQGGAVTIESAPGAGASIRIYLQRASLTKDETPPREFIQDRALHGDANIMLVEADVVLRQHLAASLQALNYRVTQAENASVARAIYQQNSAFHLVISGLQLADGSGLGLVEHIREAAPGMPAIFLMGSTLMEGADDALVFRRPISADLLARAVLEKLGRKPPTVARAEALRLSQRVRDKISHPQMRMVFDIWKRESVAGGRVPLTSLVSELRAVAKPNACLPRVSASPEPEFEFVFAGSDLEMRLGRSLGGEKLRASEENAMISMNRAYQRCARGIAYYDYARFGVRGSKGTLFERLCLPLSRNGQDVDHILSVIVFEEFGA